MSVIPCISQAQDNPTKSQSVSRDHRKALRPKVNMSKTLDQINGKSINITANNNETRSCAPSHRSLGGAYVYVCEGTPKWLASAVTQWDDSEISVVLVTQDQKTGEPKRLSVREAKVDSTTIYAEALNTHFVSNILSDETYPKVYRDFRNLSEATRTLQYPFENFVSPARVDQKYYFEPDPNGVEPSQDFMKTFTELRVAAEKRMQELKQELNPKELTVKTADGESVQCQRGQANKKSVEGRGFTQELSCELFLCKGKDKLGKPYEALLHFESDPERFSLSGPGSGGPFLFVPGERSSVKSLPIEEISSPHNTLFKGSKNNNQWGLQTSKDYAEFAAQAGIPSVAPELQVTYYRYYLQALAKNCGGMAPVWNKLQEHYVKVQKAAENQNAIMLIEKMNNVLETRFIPRSQLKSFSPGEVCHIEGDTYVRREAVSSLSPLLFEQRQLNPLSENEAKELFNEIKNMKDIPYDYVDSGCESRAHVIAERLKAKGYPVQKIWALGGKLRPFKDEIEGWRFHVAPAIPVKTKSGDVEWRVLDPALANQPESPQDWIKRFQPLSKTNTVWSKWPVPVENIDNLAKTLVYLSPPDVYLPEDQRLPDQEQQVKNQQMALTVINQKQSELDKMNIRGMQYFFKRELRIPKEASP